MDLKELNSGVDQSTHWYYTTKYIPLEKYVSKILDDADKPLTIIDIGSGTGYFAFQLEKKFQSKLRNLILVDTGYTDEEIDASKNNKAKKTKFLPETIEDSIIIMMDVLEHIEHDDLFLTDLVSKTKGINHVFLTVPAFTSLWSYHDIFLGHFRRYTLATVSSVILTAKIKITSSYYLFALLFPIAWLMRKFIRKNNEQSSDMKQSGKIVNGMMKFIFTNEMKFSKYNKVAGLTCCIEGYIEKK